MFVKRGVLPGFGLSLGYTLLYLAFLVLLPLCSLAIKAGGLGPAEFCASRPSRGRWPLIG